MRKPKLGDQMVHHADGNTYLVTGVVGQRDGFWVVEFGGAMENRATVVWWPPSECWLALPAESLPDEEEEVPWFSIIALIVVAILAAGIMSGIGK